jgi:hypothetical protein
VNLLMEIFWGCVCGSGNNFWGEDNVNVVGLSEIVWGMKKVWGELPKFFPEVGKFLPFFSALNFMETTSEPDPGSLMANAPIYSPEINFFLCYFYKFKFLLLANIFVSDLRFHF